MQSKILNGKAVATAIENDVRNKVFDFKNNYNEEITLMLK